MMITAYGDDERRRRADDLGAPDFLTKPVDFEQLKTQLRPAAHSGGLSRKGQRRCQRTGGSL
jgi:DNA-binding response OmpR family regulator